MSLAETPGPQQISAALRSSIACGWDRVIVAPMTAGSQPAPFRIPIAFGGKRGLILLGQLRTLDKARLVRRLGAANASALTATLSALQGMFAV